MTDPHLFLAFVLAASLLTITPGVDTAMVLRAATVEGARSAAAAAIGITVGCLTWGVAVALGLGALLTASEVAYTIVKLGGAGYLIWLGIGLLLKRGHAATGTNIELAGANAVAAFRRGCLTNLLNPKVGVFYVTFLPQFIPAGTNVAAHSLMLACVHVALTLAWFTILIAAAAPLSALLARPRYVRALDRITGLVFVAFGLRLASTSR